jgi:hypothetical protein
MPVLGSVIHYHDVQPRRTNVRTRCGQGMMQLWARIIGITPAIGRKRSIASKIMVHKDSDDAMKDASIEMQLPFSLDGLVSVKEAQVVQSVDADALSGVLKWIIERLPRALDEEVQTQRATMLDFDNLRERQVGSV